MAEPLSPDDVRAIARLARLALTDQEVESLRGELSAILAHMDALRALDTQGVLPMTHAVATNHALRPDAVEGSLPAHLALGQAPAHMDEHFSVPNILETNAGD